jgi:hypothetical protein
MLVTTKKGENSVGQIHEQSDGGKIFGSKLHAITNVLYIVVNRKFGKLYFIK